MRDKQRLCVRFWLKMAGKRFFLLLAPVLLLLFFGSTGIAAVGLFLIMNRSLTLFPEDNRRLMVLTVPLEREVLWRTHFLMQSILLGILSVPLLLCDRGAVVSLLADGLLLLFAHFCCARAPRSPVYVYVPAFLGAIAAPLIILALFSEKIAAVLEGLRESAAFAGLLALMTVLLLIVDLRTWRREKRRFLSGGVS